LRPKNLIGQVRSLKRTLILLSLLLAARWALGEDLPVVNATATVAAPEASAVELDRHAFGFVWIVGRTVLSASGRTLLAAGLVLHRAPRRTLSPQDAASGWLLFLLE
jgi:hypothetical protein